MVGSEYLPRITLLRGIHGGGSPSPSGRPVTNLTCGEIEAAVGDGVARLLRETYGHGPSMVRARLLGNQLTVTAEGVLTTAEKHLLSFYGGHEDGPAADVIRNFRGELFLTFQKQLIAVAEKCTGSTVIGIQDSLKCECGVKVVTITLADCPQCRPSRTIRAKTHDSSRANGSSGA